MKFMLYDELSELLAKPVYITNALCVMKRLCRNKSALCVIVPKRKKTQKVCITQTFCVLIGQYLSLMTETVYKIFIRQDRLTPIKDSTILTPRTNQTTCAMRHSADHRCRHLPLLVRQRAHIDHQYTLFIPQHIVVRQYESRNYCTKIENSGAAIRRPTWVKSFT